MLCTFFDAESDPVEADRDFVRFGTDKDKLHICYLEDVYDQDSDLQLNKSEGRQLLIDTVEAIDPDVIFIDNIASFAGYAHESDPIKYEPLKNLFLGIRTKMKKCLIVLRTRQKESRH